MPRGCCSSARTATTNNAEAALLREQAALKQAVDSKQKLEQRNQRLREATQIASDGADYYDRGQWAAAYDRFQKAEKIEPDLQTIYVHRAILFTKLGLWDRAAADYDRRFQLASRASAQTYYEHALLKLYTSDEPAYREICREMLKQFGDSGDEQAWVVRACSLSPRPAGDAADLERRGERVLASQQSGYQYMLAARANLRAGNLDQALARIREGLERSASTPGGVHRSSKSTQAIALLLKGKRLEAEQSLADVEQALQEWTKEMVDGPAGKRPINWWDWIETSLLYREAKIMISGAPPAEDPRLTVLRERAMEITRGDVYTFMESGREQVRRKAWDQAAASFSQAIESLPKSVQMGPQQMPFYVEMVQEPEVAHKLKTAHPQNYRLWWVHGSVLAAHRDWKPAAASYAAALRMMRENELWPSGVLQRPVSFAMGELAAVLLLAGDEPGYRRLCATIVQEADSFQPPHCANVFSRAISFRPGSISDPAISVRLAQRAVNDSPKTSWYLYGLGAAHYRANQYQEAVERCEESIRAQPSWLGRGQNFCILSMASSKLGRMSEARDWLAKAKESGDALEQTLGKNPFGFAGSAYLGDWLTLQILLPEAESCLQNNKPQ